MTYRQYCILELTKMYLENQGRRPHLSLFDKLKYWLGVGGYNMNYHYNIDACIDYGIKTADKILERLPEALTKDEIVIKAIEEITEDLNKK